MELWALYPELIVAAAILVLVPLAGWARGPWTRVPALVAGMALLAMMGVAARMTTWEPHAVFGGTFAADPLAAVWKVLIGPER